MDMLVPGVTWQPEQCQVRGNLSFGEIVVTGREDTRYLYKLNGQMIFFHRQKMFVFLYIEWTLLSPRKTDTRS